MPVVPMRQGPKSKGPPPPRKPPSTPFALMAAAQMHAEGRLVKPGTKQSPSVAPQGMATIAQPPAGALPPQMGGPQ